MSEAEPEAAGTGRVVGSLALLSGAVLCLVVAGVGAVAMAAHYQQHWTAFFVMERTVEAAAPVAAVLAGAVLVTGIAVALRS